MSWLQPILAPVPPSKREPEKVIPQRKRRYHHSYAVEINGVLYKDIHIAAGQLGVTERTIYRMVEKGLADVVLPKK